MLHEHALTYTDKLSVKQLDYLIKKANRSGLLGKTISRVYQEEDSEGIHIYFETEVKQ